MEVFIAPQNLPVALNSTLVSPECSTTLETFLRMVSFITTSQNLGMGSFFVIQKIHRFHNNHRAKLEQAGEVPPSLSFV